MKEGPWGRLEEGAGAPQGLLRGYPGLYSPVGYPSQGLGKEDLPVGTLTKVHVFRMWPLRSLHLFFVKCAVDRQLNFLHSKLQKTTVM